MHTSRPNREFILKPFPFPLTLSSSATSVPFTLPKSSLTSPPFTATPHHRSHPFLHIFRMPINDMRRPKLSISNFTFHSFTAATATTITNPAARANYTPILPQFAPAPSTTTACLSALNASRSASGAYGGGTLQPDAWNSATNAAITFVGKVATASSVSESRMRAARSASTSAYCCKPPRSREPAPAWLKTRSLAGSARRLVRRA